MTYNKQRQPGFKEIRKRITESLEAGEYQSAVRGGEIEQKNYLAVGKLTVAELTEILMACKGDEYTCSPHHQDPGLLVHVFKPVHKGRRWYIKVYFEEEQVIFLSAHEAGD